MMCEEVVESSFYVYKECHAIRAMTSLVLGVVDKMLGMCRTLINESIYV